MTTLHERFIQVLGQTGLSRLALPNALFYHAPAALRFEIGGGKSPYLPDGTEPDPAYIKGAFRRAKALFESLPGRPDILRIDICPEDTDHGNLCPLLYRRLGLPAPREIVKGEGEPGAEYWYWDISRGDFLPDRILREIIQADLGGLSFLCSNVYFADTERRVLYHLYDDRGADIIAESRGTLLGLYRAYQGWLLDYDRERMEGMFEEE